MWPRLWGERGRKKEGMSLYFPDDIDEGPPKPGWYATIYCWEAEEGSFYGGLYWSGSDWRSQEDRPDMRPFPVTGYSTAPFPGRAEAEAAARKMERGDYS